MMIFSSRFFIIQEILTVFLWKYGNGSHGWVRTPLARHKTKAFLSPAALEAAEIAEKEEGFLRGCI
jgi:hypothetical protein